MSGAGKYWEGGRPTKKEDWRRPRVAESSHEGERRFRWTSPDSQEAARLATTLMERRQGELRPGRDVEGKEGGESRCWKWVHGVLLLKKGGAEEDAEDAAPDESCRTGRQAGVETESA